MTSPETAEEHLGTLPEGLLDYVYADGADDDYGITDTDRADQIAPRIVSYLQEFPPANRKKVLESIMSEVDEHGISPEDASYYSICMYKKIIELLSEKI